MRNLLFIMFSIFLITACASQNLPSGGPSSVVAREPQQSGNGGQGFETYNLRKGESRVLRLWSPHQGITPTRVGCEMPAGTPDNNCELYGADYDLKGQFWQYTGGVNGGVKVVNNNFDHFLLGINGLKCQKPSPAPECALAGPGEGVNPGSIHMQQVAIGRNIVAVANKVDIIVLMVGELKKFGFCQTNPENCQVVAEANSVASGAFSHAVTIPDRRRRHRTVAVATSQDEADRFINEYRKVGLCR